MKPDPKPLLESEATADVDDQNLWWTNWEYNSHQEVRMELPLQWPSGLEQTQFFETESQLPTGTAEALTGEGFPQTVENATDFVPSQYHGSLMPSQLILRSNPYF